MEFVGHSVPATGFIVCRCEFIYVFHLIIYQGLTRYNNSSAVISDSVFQPRHLTENRMLYFWLSGQSTSTTCGVVILQYAVYFFFFFFAFWSCSLEVQQTMQISNCDINDIWPIDRICIHEHGSGTIWPAHHIGKIRGGLEHDPCCFKPSPHINK